MTSYRNNPEGPENTEATKQIEREKFALKMQHTMTPREQTLNDYDVNERGTISSPGKFEGEPIFAPHLWSLALDGFADADDGESFDFRFGPDDSDPLLKEFPEIKPYLGKRRLVRLTESEQGFVRIHSV